MLKLVHEHINQLWDETGFSLEKIRQNIIERHPTESISISKLHRILSEPSCKVSLDDLLMVVQDGFRRDPNVLLAKIGGQEYEDSKDVGYKGAAALIADFERRETAIRTAFTEQLEKEKLLRANIHQAFNEAKDAFDRAVSIMTAEHEAALKHRDETYDRVKIHLKDQLADDAKAYQQYLKDKDDSLGIMSTHVGEAMKSLKWWRTTAIITSSALATAFFYLVWELTNLDKGATTILIQMIKDGLI